MNKRCIILCLFLTALLLAIITLEIEIGAVESRIASAQNAIVENALELNTTGMQQNLDIVEKESAKLKQLQNTLQIVEYIFYSVWILTLVLRWR